MGKKTTYFGGSTIIAHNGSGWAYDECEVRNPLVKTPKSKIVRTPKATTKAKGKPAKIMWKKYVDLTATAKFNGDEPVELPIKLQHKLKKPAKSKTFGHQVALAIMEKKKT
jgi:hypothetical protein